jgi:hypothetical protein
MIWRTVVALAFLPAICWAQSFERYQAKTLDAVFDEWNDLTKTYEVGLSVIRPQKIRFVATYRLAAQPCDTRALEFVLTTLGATAILKQVSVTHCLGLSSQQGRQAIAYLQDVLVPGLKSDARLGAPIEIYADLLAYNVNSDRSRNMPILLISRFEPQPLPRNP